MASCVGNFHAKNYQNLIIGFQATVENVGDVFLRHSDYFLPQTGMSKQIDHITQKSTQ